ncbi:ankyrin repeat-containing domain protein [Mycena galericulata]|nr:ankyrin repeat-containing domain protein [Mycena galericulata]
MRDPKQLFIEWTRHKGARGHPASSTPPNNKPGVPAHGESESTALEPIVDNIGLVLELAAQATKIAQVTPFLEPAAALLSEILKSYQEVRSTKEKQDTLSTTLVDLTGDICAAVLRMEEAGQSDMIGRLKSDLEKYAQLITKASNFVNKFDSQGKLVRWAARNQLGGELDKLNQELDSFGARFRTNRLVDLAINQSTNTHTLEKVHDAVVSEKLEKWLRTPPDMTQKHHDTEKLRKDSTGLWFLEGNQFIEWQDNAGVLWIEGPSGAGKSVLSSAVISKLIADKKLFNKMETSTSTALAFFYYDFRNKEAQSVEIALRRIILQLSAQSPYPYRVLEEHYLLSKGQILPNHDDLIEILQQLLEECGRTYIILDALDECDYTNFQELVDLVLTLRKWDKTPLHLLFTSQPRQIFTEGFKDIPCVALRFDVTEDDIQFYVASEIQTNPKLKIWQNKKEEITAQVTHNSKGMFRLASCLLIELSRCKFPHQLEGKLQNLPSTLVEIYDRFFNAIDPDDWTYVEALLRWLLFSGWELTHHQLADAIAFDFSNPAQFIYKPEQQEGTKQAIFDWLEGLVVSKFQDNETKIILAHASVQDYLLDRHFTIKFHCDLNEGTSHTFITQTCITYLLHFSAYGLKDLEDSLLDHPLAEFATCDWCFHLLHSHDQTFLFTTAMQLLQPGSKQYRVFEHLLEQFGRQKPGSPLHFCCIEGYIEGVKHCLSLNINIDLVTDEGTPLAITSRRGYTDIVLLLLQKGANINVPIGRHGSALGAATWGGNVEIVQLLLEKGVDVNLPGGRHGSALGAAAWSGEMEIVHLLLENGADVNLPGGQYGSALGAAAWSGKMEIVCLLLEKGADVNLSGGHYGSALGAAASSGETEIVQLLLEKGADVNQPGGDCGSALGVAVWNDKIEIVYLLLDQGANVNLPSRKYGSALGAAAYGSKIDIVHLLLEKGADVNLQNEEGFCALVAASRAYRPSIDIMTLLLESGVDLKTHGRHALDAAQKQGNHDIVTFLHNKGVVSEQVTSSTDM